MWWNLARESRVGRWAKLSLIWDISRPSTQYDVQQKRRERETERRRDVAHTDLPLTSWFKVGSVPKISAENKPDIPPARGGEPKENQGNQKSEFTTEIALRTLFKPQNQTWFRGVVLVLWFSSGFEDAALFDTVYAVRLNL